MIVALAPVKDLDWLLSVVCEGETQDGRRREDLVVTKSGLLIYKQGRPVAGSPVVVGLSLSADKLLAADSDHAVTALAQERLLEALDEMTAELCARTMVGGGVFDSLLEEYYRHVTDHPVARVPGEAPRVGAGWRPGPRVVVARASEAAASLRRERSEGA